MKLVGAWRSGQGISRRAVVLEAELGRGDGPPGKGSWIGSEIYFPDSIAVFPLAFASLLFKIFYFYYVSSCALSKTF